MNYTVNDYLSDFKYYLKYLKSNSSSCWKLDVEKEYNKYKDEVMKCKNIVDFFILMNYLFWRKITPITKYGHNGPNSLVYDKKQCDIYKNAKCYYDIDKQINNDKKVKEIFNKYKEEWNKKMKIDKNRKIYYYRIMKNNKNENVIMIKIPTMTKADNKELNELREFLIKHKNLKELYIDIRGNGGGNSKCYEDLFKMILNETLTPNHNNIKCYFKMTKFNKPFIDYKLKDCKKDIIKDKTNHHTHYIIQKTSDIKYMSKQYVGFKGHIFIIMDKVCFSSSQMMLDETQGNKRFTILGDEKSSGAGMYGTVCCGGDNCFMDSTHFILPKTKILCFMDLFDYDRQKYFTVPDKPIPKWLK